MMFILNTFCNFSLYCFFHPRVFFFQAENVNTSRFHRAVGAGRSLAPPYGPRWCFLRSLGNGQFWRGFCRPLPSGRTTRAPLGRPWGASASSGGRRRCARASCGQREPDRSARFTLCSGRDDARPSHPGKASGRSPGQADAWSVRPRSARVS